MELLWTQPSASLAGTLSRLLVDFFLSLLLLCLVSRIGAMFSVQQTQKISELEGRISVLYQIQHDEQLLDSLVTMGPAAASSTASEMDSTVPCLDLSAAQPPNHWIKLGAKPKAPASSTPSQKELWTAARRGKHSGKLLSCLHPLQALQLTNAFSILEEQDFPPLTSHRSSQSSPEHFASLSPSPLSMELPNHASLLLSTVPHIISLLCDRASFTSPRTLKPGGSLVPVSESKKARSQQHDPSPPPACTQSSSLCPLFSPSTLIVGDSIIRDVHFFNTATHCFPGATAPVILGKLKELIPSHLLHHQNYCSRGNK